MNKRTFNIISCMLLILFTMILVGATDIRFYVEQSTSLDIREPCYKNGTYCSGSAVCNISVWKQDGITPIIVNVVMTNQGAYHNYTLNTTQTAVLGEYEVGVVCSDASVSNYETFYFEITPNGERPSTAKGMLYLGLFVVLVLFLGASIYGIIVVENMYGRFALAWVSWIFLIAVSFVAWNLSADFLTSAPFIVSMFKIVFYFVFVASFPLMLGSIAWVVYIHTVTEEMKAMMERGMSPEEAWARKRGRRFP